MGQFDSREAEHRYGWVVVGVAIVCLGIANGSVNAISVFLIPLATDLGWSRGDTAFAYMAATICVGLGGVVTGYISDRYSTRPVVLTGTVVLGVALLLLGRQQSLW
jgi:sugar phosphate permease